MIVPGHLVLRNETNMCTIKSVSYILLPKQSDSKFLISPQRQRLNDCNIIMILQWADESGTLNL